MDAPSKMSRRLDVLHTFSSVSLHPEALSSGTFLSVEPQTGIPSTEAQTSLWQWCDVTWTPRTHAFVTCLSSSGKHKDYCFWFGTEYFGHFAPVIHVYSSLSVKWKDASLFIFSDCANFPTEWTNVCLSRIQTLNCTIIVPTETTGSTCALDSKTTIGLPRLNEVIL